MLLLRAKAGAHALSHEERGGIVEYTRTLDESSFMRTEINEQLLHALEIRDPLIVSAFTEAFADIVSPMRNPSFIESVLVKAETETDHAVISSVFNALGTVFVRQQEVPPDRVQTRLVRRAASTGVWNPQPKELLVWACEASGSTALLTAWLRWVDTLPFAVYVTADLDMDRFSAVERLGVYSALSSAPVNQLQVNQDITQWTRQTIGEQIDRFRLRH